MYNTPSLWCSLNSAPSMLRTVLNGAARAAALAPRHTPASFCGFSTAPPSITEEQLEMMNAEREGMEYDVVIVGAGPAGLSAAIRLKQLEAETGREVSVCVVEKGAEVRRSCSRAVRSPVGKENSPADRLPCMTCLPCTTTLFCCLLFNMATGGRAHPLWQRLRAARPQRAAARLEGTRCAAGDGGG